MTVMLEVMQLGLTELLVNGDCTENIFRKEKTFVPQSRCCMHFSCLGESESRVFQRQGRNKLSSGVFSDGVKGAACQIDYSPVCLMYINCT